MTPTASTVASRVPRPRRSTIVWGVVIVNVQALFLVTYAAVTGRSILSSFVLFPFVWINVGLWALVRTDPPPAPARRRQVATVLAAGYFLLLAYVAGMIAPGEAFGGNPAFGLETVLYRVPPGWSPGLIYNGTLVHLSVLPPYVVGLAALTYLVYARLLEASGVVSVGVVGLFSCVSCTLPLLTAVIAGAAGISAGALLTTVAPVAYELGMVAFVVTVAILSWRPTFGTGAVGGDAKPVDRGGATSASEPDPTNDPAE